MHCTLAHVHVRASALLQAPITHPPCTHARTHRSATPTQHHCLPHPRLSHIQSYPGRTDPRERSPTKGAQGVAGSWGGAHRSRVPRCMLMKSLINFPAHNTPPSPGGGSCDEPCTAGFAGRPGEGLVRGFGVGSGTRVARLPFPGAPGAQPRRSPRALCCCCACHSRKRAASSSVSMLIALRAAGGAPGPRLRPASQAQDRLAGRQEGGITSGGRQGWAAQRTRQARTGEHRQENQCLPKCLQNIICKFKII